MKRFNFLTLFLAIVCLLPLSMQAQNRGISYQAVARDNLNNLMTNTALDVRFTIHQGGSSVFSEVQTVNTNDYGLFTAVIGSSDFAGFNAIDWQSGASALQVEIDPGSGFVNLGTTDLEAVPYSKSAETAETAALPISL